MTSIVEIVQSCYPTIEQMPFCKALREGRFGRQEILRAEIVELYRALKTRSEIQENYKEKLRDALTQGMIKQSDLDTMFDVIDDEGETEGHIDHLDMRFKLFTGTRVSRKSPLRFNADLDAINRAWMDICKESDLLTLMTITAAIEDWYAPLSAFFEVEYRKRGFSDDELELFIVHKEADLDHSTAQFEMIDRFLPRLDAGRLRTMVERTFVTSKGYDAMKLRLAEATCSLNDLVQ
ncbi:MAG: hypothetical protein FJX65_17805 [Alphaproteobacteria bacterium]|nr:hypothetical protein [Alphaproteobacteria bacterium]